MASFPSKKNKTLSSAKSFTLAVQVAAKWQSSKLMRTNKTSLKM